MPFLIVFVTPLSVFTVFDARQGDSCKRNMNKP